MNDSSIESWKSKEIQAPVSCLRGGNLGSLSKRGAEGGVEVGDLWRFVEFDRSADASWQELMGKWKVSRSW
jgi:hypothetical protein